jgi:pimeloyl-ACP methyl ester carboxylesterase
MESIPTVAVDGAQLVYHRIGGGRPLLVLNGFGATSADWDPSFIDRLASSNELILLNNRGIGGSTDDGQPFDIAKLADDAAHVIEALGFEHVSLLGWSMGGFIAQTLAVQHRARVDKLVLLSTDPGGTEADRASAAVWSKLVDMSGTPQERARRLLSLVFPSDVAGPFIANSAISWQRRVRSYLPISLIVRPRRWTRGTALASGTGCEKCICPC